NAQAESEKQHQRPDITRMTNKTVRAGINQMMIRGNRDVYREKAAKIKYRIEAQDKTQHKYADADYIEQAPRRENTSPEMVRSHNAKADARHVHE
ncbi:MAG: hypothetical protein ABR955_10055, partial [Verrucomicrobiota bacterium]